MKGMGFKNEQIIWINFTQTAQEKKTWVQTRPGREDKPGPFTKLEYSCRLTIFFYIYLLTVLRIMCLGQKRAHKKWEVNEAQRNFFYEPPSPIRFGHFSPHFHVQKKSKLKWPKVHQVIFHVIKHTYIAQIALWVQFLKFLWHHDDFWHKKWNILKAWQRTNFEFLIFFTAEVGNK